MARSFNFACDGCDKTVTSKTDSLPYDWRHVSLLVDGLFKEQWSATYDLCAICKNAYPSQANPACWPRAKVVGEATHPSAPAAPQETT